METTKILTLIKVSLLVLIIQIFPEISSAQNLTTLQTIRDLKSLSVASADNGKTVEVRYYGDVNGGLKTSNGIIVDDKGGGIFVLDTQSAFDSRYIDDGIICQANVSNGSGYWRRQFTGRVNVAWYGALANDDSADDGVLIQKAINYVRGLNSGTSGLNIHQGLGVYLPSGVYIVNSTLDLTYAGSASGISTQYYGLSVYGEDTQQTRILANITGAPVFDMTGSARGKIKNLSICSNGGSVPSCAILTARNNTNSGSGMHIFEGINIYGYFSVAGIVSISSECNVYQDVDVSNYADNSRCLFMGQTVPVGVSSPFISSIGTVGGSTRNRIYASDFAEYGIAGSCLEFSDVDSLSINGCYTKKGNSGPSVLFSKSCSNIVIDDIRDESEGPAFMDILGNVVVDSLTITGRCSRMLMGEDNSTLSNSRIHMGFIATSSTYAADFYNFQNSEIVNTTVKFRIRNSGQGSKYLTPNTYQMTGRTGNLDIDNLNGTLGGVGLQYTIAYTGGQSNYVTHIMGDTPYECHQFNKVVSRNFVYSGKTRWPQDSNANPFTPNYMTNGSVYIFELNTNLTVNNAIMLNFLPDDPEDGMEIIMIFAQDSTGSRQVNFGSNYVLNGWSVNQSPNAISSAHFHVVKLSSGLIKLVKL